MNVTVAYQDGSPTQTRGYDISGNDVFQQIAAFRSPLVSYPFSAGPLATIGEQRMALSPTESVGLNLPGASASDWDSYLSAVGSIVTSAPTSIRVAGFFNGAASSDAITVGTTTSGTQVFHEGGFYAYDLTYNSSQQEFYL